MKRILGLCLLACASIAAAQDDRPTRVDGDEARQRLMQFLQDDFMTKCAPLDGEAKLFAETDKLPLLKFAIGDNLRDVAGRVPGYLKIDEDIPQFVTTNEMMRIAFDLDGSTVTARVGGMDNVIMTLMGDDALNRLYDIDFYDQQCPLTLSVALDRAKALEAKLAEAGFTREPGVRAADEWDDYTPDHLPSWSDAEPGLTEVPKYYFSAYSTWHRGKQKALVRVENWGAEKPILPIPKELEKFSSQNIFELDGTGRKYGIRFQVDDEGLSEDGFERAMQQLKQAPKAKEHQQ